MARSTGGSRSHRWFRRWAPLALALAPAAGLAASPALLPQPAGVAPDAGAFPLAGAAVAPAADPGIAAAVARLAELQRRAGGGALPSRAGGAIRFRRDPAVAGAEAYRMAVTPAGVTVSASGDAGLFYGAETLWQLLASADGGALPATTIDDHPAFAWRGLMLDSARHMQPAAWIERLLDRMAEAKLNLFHWHLTDDQGWRLPVDRYPRLTTAGAYRHEAGTGAVYGGAYTKAEIRAVVARAAALHITVLPEIDLPGHATALVAAYPQLGSTPTPPAEPANQWGILPNLLNTEDATFSFVEHVLDEAMALFPGRYFHLGGDEAIKDQWKADPRAQARLRALGLKDEDALQGWFTARLARHLAAHGRRLVGWDEILEGAVPADATVMSWRGTAGALAAARAGHDTVMAASPVLYLDNRQSDADGETPGRGELVDWRHFYGFAVAPAALSPAERAHVLGIETALFTEHARTPEQAERMIWPRAAEAAELGWSPAASRDWGGFAPRLLAAAARWERLGWNYDRVPLQAELRTGPAGASLAQPAGIGTLRYTTDGSAPSPASPAYTRPLPFEPGLRLTAQAFLGDRPVGAARRWTLDPAMLRTRAGGELDLCANKLPLRLEDATATAEPRAIRWVDAMARCWRWPAAPLGGAGRLRAVVARVPFNFALGHDLSGVDLRAPATPAGELVARRDTCDGPVVATLPLAPAAGRTGDTELAGPLAPSAGGGHDLCVYFTQAAPAPLWVLDRLTLEPAAAP